MSKKGKTSTKAYVGKGVALKLAKQPSAPQQSTTIAAPPPGLSALRLRRLDYTGKLEVLGPLHIGTGMNATEPRPGSNLETNSYDLIWRDLKGAPWLPPTTLKGMLRALDPAPDADHHTLFGTIDPKAIMGALRFRGAAQVKPGDPIGCKQTDEGVSVLSRTAIDTGRGTARRNQLFAKEFIGKGAEFHLFLRLEGRWTEEVFERLQARVLGILSRLAAPDGVSIGANGKQGEGRIRLEDRVNRQHWQTSTRADTMGGLFKLGNEVKLPLAPATPRAWRHQITLTCPAPFLIADSHHIRDTAGGQNNPHLIPVRDPDGAVISASSILGVLRARAGWLVAIAELRNPTSPALAQASVDLLFGTTGKKGLIRVQVDRSKAESAHLMTQVKIDRFSGAGIEGALVGTKGDLVSFSVKFDIARPDADASALLDLLVNDLKKNGLQLGHSTTRGFGWFEEVKV